MTLCTKSLQYILDYFEDNDVYFTIENGDIFSTMIKCFSVFKIYKDYLVLQLKDDLNSDYYEDCMGNLECISLEGSEKVSLIEIYHDGKEEFDEDRIFEEYLR